MTNGNFRKRLPKIYENVSYTKGLCPIAEEVQSKLMVFKTNYRNLELAQEKANILRNTIESIIK